MLKLDSKPTKQSQQPPTVSRGERRLHIRYQRPGCITFDCRGRRYTGAVVNVSKSGILFLADVPPPLGATGTLSLQLMGAAKVLTSDARVLRRYVAGGAAEFVLPSRELDQYIPWPPHGPTISHAA